MKISDRENSEQIKNFQNTEGLKSTSHATGIITLEILILSSEPGQTSATSCCLKLFYGKFKILIKNNLILFVNRDQFEISKTAKKIQELFF